MKQIGKKHKWLVCLLAIVMLVGVITPLGIALAENVTKTGTLALTSAYANGTSPYSYACLEFKSTTTMNLQTGKLTADGGAVLYNGASLGTYAIRVDNVNGTFVIDGIAAPKATDTFTVKGQFKYTEESKTTKIEFPETTFQYMGLNANQKGYWRDYTETVESGVLTLASESIDGSNQYGWGGFRFTTANGYVPAPRGINTQKFQSNGGKITLKANQDAEEVELTLGTDINLKAGDSSTDRRYFIEDYKGGAFTSGNIITIQGEFKTADGFSINIAKTAFKYEPEGTSYKWSYYTEVRDSGEVTLEQNGKITSEAAVYFWPANKTDVTFSSDVQLMPISGNGKILANGNDVSSSAGLYSYTNGSNAIWGISTAVGTEITLEGEFALANDTTIVVNYPQIVFKVIETTEGGRKWVQVRTTNYVESGDIDVHDNSSSADKSKADLIWFQTDNTVLAEKIAGDEWLRPEQGTILYNGKDITSSVKDGNSAKIYSHSNGVYLLYTLRGAENGTKVSIQGTFAMSDGTIGIDFKPTTFEYVVPEGKDKGFWLLEGEELPSQDTRINVAITSDIETTHPNTWGENNGFGIANMIDGKGASGNYGITDEKKDYQNTPISITLTFDKTYKVSKACLYAIADGGFPEDFVLEAYTKDGWKTVVSKNGYVAEAGEQSFEFDAIDCRMFRLTTSKNGATKNKTKEGETQYAIFLREFEVYGETSSEVIEVPTPPVSDGGEVPPSDDSRINVAVTSEIKTTHPNTWGENNGFGIANMIDGKGASGNWGITDEKKDYQNTKMSITLTFDKTYKVSKACLYAVADGGFPEDFVLEAYTKEGWKTVVSKSGYAAEAGEQSFEFDAIDCRMLRLTTTKNGATKSGYAIFLREFEVYGVASNIVIEPEVLEEEKSSEETRPNIAAASNGSTISTTHPDAWGEKNGFGIANMIDGKGNAGNYGITLATADYQNTEISISVNFKQAYKVNKICLYAVADGGFPEDFTLAAYTQSGWKTVLTKKGYKAEAGCQTFEIEPTDCTAVKLISTKNGATHQGKYGIYLKEFEVYGEASNVSIPKAPTLGTEGASSGSTSFSYNADKNIALNMPATCNSDYAQYGFGIDNVNDGNLNSPWSCNMLLVEKDKPEWVEINLLGNYKINTVALYARANGWGFPKDIKISVFYDDNWIEVVNVKNYKVATDVKTTAEYVFKFKETIGNKIRIEGSNFNMADGEYGMQLTEIAVYGDEAIGNYILPLNNYVSSATDITTSSTLEDFGFFTLYLTDGDVKTGYSSNQHTDPNNIEWIELNLKRSLNIGSILLKPAVAGSGFPVDFEIQVMMDGKWETIHKVTDYKKPVDESWQQFVLDKQYKTDKVRIWVTKLGDDFGQYSLRLNEIEIYPSEVKDKDMEAVEVGNIEHASYNSAHTIETKTIIPTALIVSGVVVVATAFIGIVGVYILTLRKMKRKEK